MVCSYLSTRFSTYLGAHRTRTCTVQKGGGEASPTPRSTDVSAPLLPPLGAPLLTPNGVPRRHDDAPLRIAAFRTRRRSGIGARRGQRVAVHAALSIRTGHRTVQSPSRRGFLGQLFFRRRIEKGTGGAGPRCCGRGPRQRGRTARSVPASSTEGDSTRTTLLLLRLLLLLQQEEPTRAT